MAQDRATEQEREAAEPVGAEIVLASGPAGSFVLGALVFLAYAWLVLGGLGEGSLRDWDEAWYAVVSREMLRSGDYLFPRYDGEPFYEKPPLYFWVTAACYDIWGTGELGARLPAALSGWGCLILVMLWFRSVAGVPGRASWPALILLGNPHFLIFCARGQMDVPMAFLSLLTLYLLWRASPWPGQSGKGRGWAPAYIFAGLVTAAAVMLKGLPAFLPWVVFGVVAAILGKETRRELRQGLFWKGLALAILVSGPWHVLQLLTYGRDYGDCYFGNQLFGRLFRNINPDTALLPGHYYVGILISRMGLGVAALLAFLPWAGYRLFRRRDRLLSLWLTFLAGLFVLLSLAASKAHWYLIPFYPVAALFIAYALDRVVPIAWPRWLVPGGMAVVMVVALARNDVRRRDYNPELKAQAREIRRALPPGERLVIYHGGEEKYGLYAPAALFYLDRSVEGVPDGAALKRRAATGTPFWLLLHRANREILRPLLSRPVLAGEDRVLWLYRVDGSGDSRD